MSVYTPNKWLVLSIKHKNKTVYRVFGTWSGGYLYGDSWSMNSGITRAELVDGVYLFHGNSGSVYHCRKDGMYGSTAYGFSVISNMIENTNKSATVEIMDANTNFLELDYNALA